jgi:hypothetical protein
MTELVAQLVQLTQSEAHEDRVGHHGPRTSLSRGYENMQNIHIQLVPETAFLRSPRGDMYENMLKYSHPIITAGTYRIRFG